MKFKLTREGNGLIGIYWCPANKELAFNVSAWLGFRLRFCFSEKERERFAANMLAVLEEKAQLGSMSNAELVQQVVKLDAANYEEVLEMMDRLDPHWYEDKEAVS